MRGFCGWFSDRTGAEAGLTLQRMLVSACPPATHVDTRPMPTAGLAACGEVARPTLHVEDDYAVVLAGHPRLREGNERTADPGRLARALRQRGGAALAEFGGDFAVAAWDLRTRRGLIAIDRIGVHQLVYARVDGALAFATSLDMLCGYPGVQRSLSPQAIYDFLYFHVSPGPGTIYTGLERVPPGHFIEFGADGAGAPKPYWTLRFTEGREAPFEELKAEFMGLLKAAVGEAADGSRSGAFLSGGTDSSTVSGMLAGTVERAQTFSIGFDVPGYDETEYARIAAKHYRTDHHEHYIKPTDVVDAVPRIAASYDQPFGNASAVPTFQCARLAQSHGVERLLAGDGGDELFGGNERYAKHHLLSLYGRVPGFLRSGLIEPLLLSGSLAGASAPLRKLRSYVEQARPDMPWRYESYNLLQHLGAQNVLTPEFLAAADVQHPRMLLRDAHAPHASDSLINQMLAIDLRFILADGDLPKVTHMCNLAGVDVAFPLLDDRIIEFSQRLPSPMKLRGTKLRWFFKQALDDFLPPEIITKKKHGFGLPVGPWLLQHQPLKDLAIDSIRLLKPRGIVRPAFIDELVDVKLHEQPAYYGTMVWLLMMLGLWLDSRKL